MGVDRFFEVTVVRVLRGTAGGEENGECKRGESRFFHEIVFQIISGMGPPKIYRMVACTGNFLSSVNRFEYRQFLMLSASPIRVLPQQHIGR